MLYSQKYQFCDVIKRVVVTNMNYNDFKSMGNKKCSSLNIVLKSDGILGGPHSVKFGYDYNGSILHIEIEQLNVRSISLSAASPIMMEHLWFFYTTLERLLMLFDGRFYIMESVTFIGDACSEDEYASYANECLSRRLSYCKTDPAYCYTDHVFLMYDTVLSPELIKKWIELQNELNIVHQVVLYNIADTGITCDVKCAYFIECLEPMSEIIGIYDRFFPSLKSGDRKTTLKMCIDSVISKYGKDIFAEEYNTKKEKFLQTFVDTRVRIMHINRNQPVGKHLSGEESVLYLIKLCHLYRVVILSLLGIDYDKYRSAVVKSVNQWNNWNGTLQNFINRLK